MMFERNVLSFLPPPSTVPRCFLLFSHPLSFRRVERHDTSVTTARTCLVSLYYRSRPFFSPCPPIFRSIRLTLHRAWRHWIGVPCVVPFSSSLSITPSPRFLSTASGAAGPLFSSAFGLAGVLVFFSHTFALTFQLQSSCFLVRSLPGIGSSRLVFSRLLPPLRSSPVQHINSSIRPFSPRRPAVSSKVLP